MPQKARKDYKVFLLGLPVAILAQLYLVKTVTCNTPDSVFWCVVVLTTVGLASFEFFFMYRLFGNNKKLLFIDMLILIALMGFLSYQITWFSLFGASGGLFSCGGGF